MNDKLTPLKLLDLVYPVIPSGGGESGKAPLVNWVEYQTSYPTPQDLESWEKTLHPTLWGIVTGQMSGVVVVDVDKPELRTIFDAAGLSPHIKTPRGGYHFWFRHPNTPVKTAVGILPGIDIRADGGFVNVIGKRADGEYQTLIVPSPDNVYPWEKLPAPIKEALNNNHTKATVPQDKRNWITQAMQGVPEGQRDAVCTRLAGYFLKGSQPDIVKTLLYPFADRCTPPFPHNEVDKCVDSITKRDTTIPIGVPTLSLLKRDREEISPENQISYATRQPTRQSPDNEVLGKRAKGELSTAFDEFLHDNPEPHWKKDVAEILGTTYRDESFQAVVRRRAKDSAIKITHGGDKIQWVNKDWRRSLIPLEVGERPFLGLALPFGAEKYILTPEHCQVVVAGDVGSGKTHFGYLLAELNIGRIPIRHFVNEIGESKAIRNLDDFPILLEHFGKDYYLINQDKEQLEVAENLDPEGLNIYDYLHLPVSKEWFLWLQKELSKLSQKLTTGAIVVFLQKKRGVGLAMGGEGTKMQCEVYLNLNITQDVKGDDTNYGYKEGRIDIIKCRNWNSKINPETLSLLYRTAPKWGKLTPLSLDWTVMERN